MRYKICREEEICYGDKNFMTGGKFLNVIMGQSISTKLHSDLDHYVTVCSPLMAIPLEKCVSKYKALQWWKW